MVVQEKYKKFKEHRRVNSTLGKSPSIGPIPADQLLPWGIVLFFSLLDLLQKFFMV